MWKHVNQIRVGDHIKMWRGQPTAFGVPGGKYDWVVTRIDHYTEEVPRVYGNIQTIWSGNRRVWTIGPRTDGIEFWVEPREPSQYPHECPRCGNPAYVGLFEVEHRGLVVGCPARKK